MSLPLTNPNVHTIIRRMTAGPENPHHERRVMRAPNGTIYVITVRRTAPPNGHIDARVGDLRTRNSQQNIQNQNNSARTGLM